jgi:hypothetical protein
MSSKADIESIRFLWIGPTGGESIWTCCDFFTYMQIDNVAGGRRMSKGTVHLHVAQIADWLRDIRR